MMITVAHRRATKSTDPPTDVAITSTAEFEAGNKSAHV